MSLDRIRAHRAGRYLFGVAASVSTVAVLIPLRFLIEPLPAPPFLLTVIAVAWFVGLGPALVSVAVCAFAIDYWFIPPLFAVTTTWHEVASVVSFALVGVVVAWLTATRRHAEDERKALLARERAARASAEAANRAKDEFVAVLGHEFRNPLSAISTAVQLLDRVGKPDDTSTNAREVIARQARNIARMVDDLMEVNRIAAGKIRLDPRPMDLAETVRRCVATLAGAGRTERHALAVHGEAVWVEADPVRVEQIVVNLLDNALKYTPPGGAVDVTIARESGHGVLRVQDTGVGIPREMLTRIFDLFVQGQPGAIRGRSGLGIGLAVVHHLAELHGGTIEASSDGPGRGSTFRLRLRSAPAPRAETSRARRPATDTPRRRIVVVEDDPDIRGMLRRLLEASGQDVAEAEDGPSAFEIAVRVRPDLMLVDIGLAGFDGYELARRLRTMPETKAAVLVALTGYGRPEDVARSLAAGFDHHAVKPLAPDALAEILRR